jgi:hypothetical protein
MVLENPEVPQYTWQAGHHWWKTSEVAHLKRDGECLRCQLAALGVQALPHLDTAVRHSHAAVHEDAHQRASLIHGLKGEGDAKLGSDGSEPPLAPSAVSKSC